MRFKCLKFLHKIKIIIKTVLIPSISILLESWNKAEVSVIKGHENDDVNKAILLLLCISDTGKRWGCKNTYDQIDTDFKGKYV